MIPPSIHQDQEGHKERDRSIKRNDGREKGKRNEEVKEKDVKARKKI